MLPWTLNSLDSLQENRSLNQPYRSDFWFHCPKKSELHPQINVISRAKIPPFFFNGYFSPLDAIIIFLFSEASFLNEWSVGYLSRTQLNYPLNDVKFVLLESEIGVGCIWPSRENWCAVDLSLLSLKSSSFIRIPYSEQKKKKNWD